MTDMTMLTGTPGALPDPQARVFDSTEAPADPTVLRALNRAAADTDLAAPPVVLPDFHHKRDLEMPSSIAVATRATVRPEFTSPSVNCGMALLALDIDVPGEAALHRYFDEIRRRYPHPPRWRWELSLTDVLACAETGAEFGVDRYGLHPEALERIEEGGRLDLDRYGGLKRLRRELPALSLQLARLRFGTIGPSDHFVELQQVEEILDPQAAAVLGVAAGQLTLQYHAGGGQLTGQVGRLFARRQKMSRPLAATMLINRPLAHLATARSAAQIRERLALYFTGGCPVIPVEGTEGERVLLANAAAMNYGFAFRTATYGTLTALARDVLGAREVRLIVDSPHNSIYEEDIGGQRAIVHRHNSCRAYPASKMTPGTAFGTVGQALLVPGTHRTSSYLCVAADGAEGSLYTACHGAGTIIDQFAASGRSGQDGRHRTTLRFRYRQDGPTAVPQLDDRGVDEALAILSRNGLVKPVARLHPVAVLN
ncbi:RtcB family protein [Streptomyces sp. TLI_185]|uniref:RtcB family protein n=1 Tax=Streptomyces sp. TLI_185 TaxID=2485151 RepID=UPI000F51326F|nr:RtcB family protein [Streptomyces sp. TLI_185]RPF38093.1 RNA-splicing ligase RtcB [Streptomyces sp. TLI_185]